MVWTCLNDSRWWCGLKYQIIMQLGAANMSFKCKTAWTSKYINAKKTTQQNSRQVSKHNTVETQIWKQQWAEPPHKSWQVSISSACCMWFDTIFFSKGHTQSFRNIIYMCTRNKVQVCISQHHRNAKVGREISGKSLETFVVEQTCLRGLCNILTKAMNEQKTCKPAT